MYGRAKCDLTCCLSSEVPQADFTLLFEVMQTAMQKMYENSHWGWNKEKKRAEMLESDMFFLIAHDESV